jgi:predicted P-loop ATPase
MVASWVNPWVVNNVILVLIGEQGSYKTTWFQYLLPPELRQYFYTKTNANRMSRDDLITLSEFGLVCCEELDTMRPSELNQLKAAVTMPAVNERAAYAHYAERREHIASFCGTGNNIQFLSDPTGNRRWLPFEVEYITSPREVPFEYEGIFAQAYALYKQGFQYWFGQTDIQQLSRHNRHFETPSLETELIQLYFRKPRDGEPGEFMPVSLAIQIVGVGITQKLSTVMLGRAFVEQGFERKTYRNTRGYVVVRRTAEEMRSLRSLMAVAGEDTDTDDTDVF